MLIRLRLALWHSGLTGIVLIFVSLTSYAIHTRAHYDDLDRVMVQVTRHVAEEYEAAAVASRLDELLANPTAPDLVIHVVDADGHELSPAPQTFPVTSAEPLRILANPSGPPYDWIERLAPPLVRVPAGEGAFGFASDDEDRRWRLYTLPAPEAGVYLLTAAPLERIDASVRRFRELVILLSIAGAALTLVAGGLLASQALRPVAVLTETAREIARSRGFGRRVPIR